MLDAKKRVNSAYTFAVVDGKQEFNFGAVGKLTFDPALVSAENRARAMMHGFKQRIIDNAAIKAEDNGRVNVQAKFDAMKQIIDHLESGAADWNVKQAARATGPDVGLLIRALIEMGKTATVEAANVLFERLAVKREITRDEAVKLLWDAKDVGLKVAELRAEAKTGKVDADDLLDDLESDE